MKKYMIIKIEPYENGGHDNQTASFKKIPEGWAKIPDDMELPNFPFGDIEVEETDGVMTVTKWTALPKPEPTPIPDTVESLKAQLEETDYKIIKCFEYQMAGQELPYDIDELHAERQAIRDKINELEAKENISIAVGEEIEEEVTDE